MSNTLAVSKKTIGAMVNEYTVLLQGLAEIAARHNMSRGTVRRLLVNEGVRIRSKTEHHTIKASGKVKVTNLPAAAPTNTKSLLKDLLSMGHITQAEIDQLATFQLLSTTPVAASPAPSTGISFDGMTAGEKERAGLQEVMRIVAATSKVSTIKQQQYADLWGRSGSWVSHNQAK